MSNSMWASIFGSNAGQSHLHSNNMGQSISSSVGAQQAQGSFSQQAQGSFSQQALQQYNSNLAQQSHLYNYNRQTYEWVFNGCPVSITQFAELAYGDSPQKTMFLLKYSEKENQNA